MGLARRIDMDDVQVSDDARRRIDSVLVRQLAFEVKKLAPTASDDDAEMLATVISEVVDAKRAVDGATVRAALRARNRSQEAADRLARLIGL